MVSLLGFPEIIINTFPTNNLLDSLKGNSETIYPCKFPINSYRKFGPLLKHKILQINLSFELRQKAFLNSLLNEIETKTLVYLQGKLNINCCF